MSTALEIIELETKRLELDTQSFELEQRRASALSKSAFFPKDLQGDIASAIQIHDLSKRMNISVLEIAQSVYLIYGRPSFATTFLVARLNQSGLIAGALRTVISDDKQKAHCIATDVATGEEMEGMEITMEIAHKEGWVSKKGSKWQTMPELMLRKRAQSFFIKEYYPQVMFGMQSQEELIDAEVVDTYEVASKEDTLNQYLTKAAVEPSLQEVVKPTPREEVSKAPIRRVPRHVSAKYPILEKSGLKKNDCRKFVDWMGWMDIEKHIIEEFFSNSETGKDYINRFYGKDKSEAIDADYSEVADPKPSPMVTQERMLVQTQENNTQEPKAGIGSMARYNGTFIKKGILPADIDAFITWSELTPENIQLFIDDEGAVDALVEEFMIESGYSEE